MATLSAFGKSDEECLLGSDSDDARYSPVLLKTIKKGIDTVTSIAFGKDPQIGYYAFICYSNKHLSAFSHNGEYIQDILSCYLKKCGEYHIHDIAWAQQKDRDITYDDEELELNISIHGQNMRMLFLNNFANFNFLHTYDFESEIFDQDLTRPIMIEDDIEKLEDPYGNKAIGLSVFKFKDDNKITIAVCFVDSRTYDVNKRSRRYVALYKITKKEIVLELEYRDTRKTEKLFTYPKKSSKSNVEDLWVIDRKARRNGDVKVFNISNKCRNFKFLFTYSGKTGSTFDPMDIKPSNDLMVISDCSNHNVHLVKNDGNFLMHVMTGSQGLQFPRALCVDFFDRIWIGCNDGSVHILKFRDEFEA